MALNPDLIRERVPETDASIGRPIKWGVVRASVVAGSDRRLEGSSYLSDGFGVRNALEAVASGWSHLNSKAAIWQPSRLKGVVVSSERGVPFLSAGQVFEASPKPRKFLALAHTPNAAARFVQAGWILMSCSGDVGKVTVAHSPHLNALITHDLLRLEVRDENDAGWLYALMRTETFRSMAVASHYGHVIKHIEAAHLAKLPVLDVEAGRANWFNTQVTAVFAKRDAAHSAERTAYDQYANAIGMPSRPAFDKPSVVRASGLTTGRRRLDAYNHNPQAQAIEIWLREHFDVHPLGSLAKRVFAPGRFRREFGPNGTPYRSAEELFDLNAPVSKRIYAGLVEDRDAYMLHPRWVVMACSGQIYGLNGAAMLLNEGHEGVFATHDLIRIVPDETVVRRGYLLCALTHPDLGRPLVIRDAYGTSIPHLDVIDVRQIPIPRVEPAIEQSIADAFEGVAALRAEADALENSVTAEAQQRLARFLRGQS